MNHRVLSSYSTYTKMLLIVLRINLLSVHVDERTQKGINRTRHPRGSRWNSNKRERDLSTVQWHQSPSKGVLTTDIIP